MANREKALDAFTMQKAKGKLFKATTHGNTQNHAPAALISRSVYNDIVVDIADKRDPRTEIFYTPPSRGTLDLTQ